MTRAATEAGFLTMLRLAAEPSRNSPSWMQAGISLNPRNYETWSASEQHSRDTQRKDGE